MGLQYCNSLLCITSSPSISPFVWITKTPTIYSMKFFTNSVYMAAYSTVTREGTSRPPLQRIISTQFGNTTSIVQIYLRRNTSSKTAKCGKVQYQKYSKAELVKSCRISVASNSVTFHLVFIGPDKHHLDEDYNLHKKVEKGFTQQAKRFRPNVGLLLDHHLQRQLNTKPSLGQHLSNNRQK